MLEKIFLKSRAFVVVLILLTAVGISVSGIIYEQKLFRMLPLYISLIVVIMNSQAWRIGALIGGLNSILYAAVFFNYDLYGSALSALLVSFPFQIATFILWSRRKDGATTKFRSLGPKRSIILYMSLVIIYIPLLIANINAGAAFAPIDTALSILGFVVTVLTMFAFVEFTYLSIINSTLSLVLYILMIKDTPEQMCYLIYSVYGLICVIRAAVNIRKIYSEQKKKSNG